MIALIDTSQFKIYISSDTFINSVVKYPEKKKALEHHSNRLKDTDNPWF